MSQKYEKLKALLKELFQLDQPDLDFGLYRIMHAKSGEVTLEEQCQIQVKMRKFEREQRRQRQEIFKVEDEIMGKRDELIDALERRLAQRTEMVTLFSIRWAVE